jgi:hypothetical protein
MTFSTNLTWQLLTINCYIAFAIVTPLYLLIHLFPSRAPTGL